MIIFSIIMIIVITVFVFSFYKRSFTIKQGTHSALIEVCPHLGIRSMKRTIVFDKSCLYTDKSREDDWNKVFGFSYGHHRNTSFRIGWRCKNGIIETCLYYYVNGKRDIKTLTNIEYNTPYEFVITLEKDNSISVKYMNNISNVGLAYFYVVEGIKSKFGYYLYPYFGGQEKAPHNMKLRIFKK